MLTSKQRSYLRKVANKYEDIIFIGKDGMSDNIVMQVREAIKKRELIKGKVLNNSLEDVIEVANYLADKVDADVVCTIGNKFVLYKQNEENTIINLFNR